MKPLILTLIFAVITTTIGAGWVITRIHSKYHSDSGETDRNLIAYKQLGHAIGQTLEDFPDQDKFIAYWQEKTSIDISIQEQPDFPVPDDLSDEFKNGTPLLLESRGEMSLHLYMENTDQVLSLISPVQENAQPTSINLILTLLFYLSVVAVLLAWLYPLIKRLVMLQKAANKIGTGDLSSRVQLSKYSYISSIETEFNRMAGQIEKLVDDNQLLCRAVSHNLKTPITRLRMGVDVLEEAKSQSDTDQYIKRINNDLDEMQSLVETLLEYSKLDSFRLPPKSESIDLRDFVPRLIETESMGNIEIASFYSDDSLLIKTDPQYLAMSLTNILSNANQHAKSLVNIRVESLKMDTRGKAISISVDDDGNGIPESDYQHITKPFWRGSSDQKIKGHGMGLAIVERIAEWLRADLSIKKSASLGGASVSMVFCNVADSSRF